jgi:penicillin amidase
MHNLLIASCLLLLVSVNAAAQDHSYSVSGLEQEAEIIVDEWGVPHIYANTHYDAFFVQGFNAARDRLWTIGGIRRRVRGTGSRDQTIPLPGRHVS